jgi:hypothetical protein
VLDETGTVVVQGHDRLLVEIRGQPRLSGSSLSPLPFAAGARRLGRGCMPCVIYDGWTRRVHRASQEDGQFGIPEARRCQRSRRASPLTVSSEDLISTRSTCAITDPEGDRTSAQATTATVSSEANGATSPRRTSPRVEGVPPADICQVRRRDLQHLRAQSKGELWCWGANGFEAIHPSNQGTILPTRVEPFDDVVDFAACPPSRCAFCARTAACGAVGDLRAATAAKASTGPRSASRSVGRSDAARPRPLQP